MMPVYVIRSITLHPDGRDHLYLSYPDPHHTHDVLRRRIASVLRSGGRRFMLEWPFGFTDDSKEGVRPLTHGETIFTLRHLTEGILHTLRAVEGVEIIVTRYNPDPWVDEMVEQGASVCTPSMSSYYLDLSKNGVPVYCSRPPVELVEPECPHEQGVMVPRFRPLPGIHWYVEDDGYMRTSWKVENRELCWPQIPRSVPPEGYDPLCCLPPPEVPRGSFGVLTTSASKLWTSIGYADRGFQLYTSSAYAFSKHRALA